VKVTGVYKAFPSNSHMHPGMLISFNTLKDSAVYGAENLRTNWGNNSFFTYLLLPEHYDAERMIAQFPAFVDRRMDHKDYNGDRPSKYTKLGLQKLTDIHLYSHTDYEAEPNGDIARVYIFFNHCIFHFIDSLYQLYEFIHCPFGIESKGNRYPESDRCKKKRIDFSISQRICTDFLRRHFNSFILLYFSLPWLNKISEQQLSIRILMNWKILIPICLTPFVVGILSGLYPALFMSSFQPVKH